MANFKALLDQTSACCRLLETLGGTPLVEGVAAKQAQSLMSLAKPLKLLPSEVADLASAVSKSCFPEVHKHSLLTCFTSKLVSVGDVSTDAPKAKFQDYTEASKFLTVPVWQSMAEGPTVFMNHMMMLGLRQPGEPTFQTLASLLLLATEGEYKAMNMSPQAKNMHLKMFKTWWRKAVGPRKQEWDPNLAELPPTPEQLRTMFPAVYALAFKEAEPMPCPTTQLNLAMLSSNCFMRMTALRKNQLLTTTQQLATIPTQPTPMDQGLAIALQRFNSFLDRNEGLPL